MIAKSVFGSLLTACMAAYAQPPTQGLGFAIVGVAPGQSVRINALNQAPGLALQGQAGCRISLQFYDTEGQLVTEFIVPVLAAGKSASLELNRDDLPGGGRLSLRAVLAFGYSGGANPPPLLLQQTATCNIVPSLEIYDNDTQKTNILVTDARPLPGPPIPEP